MNIDKATFTDEINDAKNRIEDIGASLDRNLGFRSEEMTSDAVEIIRALLDELDDALTITEKIEDLNQALHQGDEDNPARAASQAMTAEEYTGYLNA